MHCLLDLVVLLEALDVEGNLALLTHKLGLGILPALQAALFAVAPGGLALLVVLRVDHPVVHAIEPHVQ